MGGKIGFIVFIIILAGIGLYLITSGVISNGFSALNSLVSSTTVGGFFHSSSTSATSSGYSSSFTPPGYLTPIGGTSNNNSGQITNNQQTNSNTSGITPSDIPAGYTAAQLSKYFHQVRFGSVIAGNSYYYGTITLNAYPTNASTAIDITGWEIKSRNSGEYIPQAVLIYDSSGAESASDIRVKNGDTVSFYSSSAPFNLRLNKCIGYVAHVANFVPALPLSCPYIDHSSIQNLSGQCQNYIESIGSCQAPNMANPQVSQSDYTCQDYLNNNFTYRSCVDHHEGDPDFLSNQVWVWTGSNVVDQYHDNVVLLDRTGLVVDIYNY